jgi:hypothetical protein
MPRTIAVLSVSLLAVASTWMLPAVGDSDSTTARPPHLTNAGVGEPPMVVAAACPCIEECGVRRDGCRAACPRGDDMSGCYVRCGESYDSCVANCKRSSPSC